MAFPLEYLWAVIGLSYASYLFFRNRRLSYLDHIPSPPCPSRFFGHMPDILQAPCGTRWNVFARKYGSVYRLRGVFREPLLVMGDPKGIHHILSAKPYPRTELERAALRTFFGSSVIAAEGDDHRRLRRILNPAFTKTGVQEVAPVLMGLAKRLADQWETLINASEASAPVTSSRRCAIPAQAQVCSMLATLLKGSACAYYSLDAICLTTFNYELEASDFLIEDVLTKIANSPIPSGLAFAIRQIILLYVPVLLRLPSPMKKWLAAMHTELGAIADKVMATAKAGNEGPGNILALLASSGESTESQLTKEEGIAQIMALLFAGHDTVANVMSECLYELSQNSRIQTGLRDELLTFEASHGYAQTIKDLLVPESLPYLDALTSETIRCKGVVMALNRVAPYDDTIPLELPIAGTSRKEIFVRKGQPIVIPIRDGINVDEAIWGPDAAVYRPERWLEPDGLPDVAKSIRAYTNTLTFGDEPKVCIGRYFAIAEFKIVIAQLVRNFTFESVDPAITFIGWGVTR